MSPFYEKLTFELEFITPAFIGGAFPDEEAELRPASFIGILRWWFRNLALTVTDDIEAIAHLESELFGNQKRAGKVWVKVKRQELNGETKGEILGSQLFLTSSSIGRCSQENRNFSSKLQQLISYDRRNNIYRPLTYTTFGLNENRLAIWGKVCIEFILPLKYKKLIKSFLALLNLVGTIGSKRTKGWGSFKLIEKRNNEEITTANFKNLFREFQNELSKFNIKINRQYSLRELKILELKNFKLANCLDSSNHRAYPGLHLLSYISLAYKLFRFKLQPDYNEATQFLSNPRRNMPIIYNRATLGLPISNISTRNYRNIQRINIDHLSYLNKNFKRLANPFIFKIRDDESILFIAFKPKTFGNVLNNLKVVGKYEVKNRNTNNWQKRRDLNIDFGLIRGNNRFYKNFSEEQNFLLGKLENFLNQMFDVEEIYPEGG